MWPAEAFDYLGHVISFGGLRESWWRGDMLGVQVHVCMENSSTIAAQGNEDKLSGLWTNSKDILKMTY
jgi:hypothetical protein